MGKIKFENNILILGFGTISRAVLPLILDHFDIGPHQMKVFAKEVSDINLTSALKLKVNELTLTKENYKSKLNEIANSGDLVVNLTAEVSSIDLMRYCSQNSILYLDTCIEMWPEDITPNSKTYDEREMLLDLQKELPQNSTTALSSMGANPGIVSLLTKRALTLICEEIGIQVPPLNSKSDWAKLARDLSVKVIHVNERDTQFTNEVVTPDDFISTWSVEAMIVESIESAEMSIGTHEYKIPDGAKLNGQKNNRDVFFSKSGKDVKISTWLPLAGEIEGMILNHNEPYSIAELYAISDEIGAYSPTTCFVYHPCDQTMESLKYLTVENHQNKKGKLSLHNIIDGRDELGVFVMTEKHGSFWLGSQLDIHTARRINPESSATSLQVAGGVLGGMCWIINNANCGVREPEDIQEYELILGAAEKYWDGYIFTSSNWLPGKNNPDDTLQFTSFLATP